MARAERRGPASKVVVGDLNGATIENAPECCVACTWWQDRMQGRPTDKRRFIETVEEEFGPWGKLYRDGDRLIAFLQYGPAEAFPRARDLPAGPPAHDAVLITCSFLLDPASPWALQSLFLACIGEVRDAGHESIETFAYRYDEGDDFSSRFLRHRTVFPRDFLSDFGFRTVRTAGRVELMRLELRGIVPVPAPADTALERAWGTLRARLAGVPAPVP